MNDDGIPEIDGPPIAVDETHLLFRLSQKGGGRYVAIVATQS